MKIPKASMETEGGVGALSWEHCEESGLEGTDGQLEVQGMS